MKITAVVEVLVSTGATPEMILAAVKAMESQQVDALEKRRESDRERQARKRAVTLCHVKSERSRPHVRVEDISSNKQITEKKEEKKDSAPKARGDLEAFRSELSPTLDAERIEALIAVRRKKGATFSAHAGRLLSKALSACPDAADAADEMVLRNWTGVKPEWLESRNEKRATSPPNRKPNAFDAYEEICRQRGWSTANEPEILPGLNGDAERLPAERGEHSGAVVDLRKGADWRRGTGH